MPDHRITPVRSAAELVEARDWLSDLRRMQARLRDRERRGLPAEAPERQLAHALEKAALAAELRIAVWRQHQRLREEVVRRSGGACAR